MKLFTEKTVPIIIAIFLLFAASLFLSNISAVGMGPLVLQSQEENRQNTLQGVTFDYSIVAGIIIVLVALVSTIAYFSHASKSRRGAGKGRRRGRRRVRRGRKRRG